MNATKPTTKRFFHAFIAIETPAGRGKTEVVVDRRSRETVEYAGEMVFYRAYARPEFLAWTIGMYGCNFVNSDPEWLAPLYSIRSDVKEGELVEPDFAVLKGRITAASQPSLFGCVCSAFEMQNPAVDATP